MLIRYALALLPLFILFTGAPLTVVGAQPDPAAVRRNVMKNPWLRKTDGELFCWHSSGGARQLLTGYKAYRDPAWLAEAVTYMDWRVETGVSNDPDGYPGTIGTFVNVDKKKGKVWTDTVIGDALVATPLLEFVEIVRGDPELRQRWQDKADEYQQLAIRMCWEKWNKRGCYYEDRIGYGSYHTYEKVIDPETETWIERKNDPISDNLNKHYAMGIVCLKLWHLTGEEKYKDRVKSIFSRAKAMWRHYPEQDRVVWNFWMPHGPYDIDGSSPRSWVSVHPNRAGYQAGEVADIVEVYDSGLVFDKEDLQRIIRTNHWMADHNWRSADGSTKAGTLWSALARFDERLRKIHEKRLANPRGAPGRIRLDYYRNVTKKRLGWDRLDVDEGDNIERVDPPLQPGTKISMAMTIPTVVETINNDRIRLACKTLEQGKVSIELLDESRTEILGTLTTEQSGKGGSYHAPLWDGTNPATGEKTFGRYNIRWTINGESRFWPVWVERGEKEESDTATKVLKENETITIGFEEDPGPRWELKGAQISEQRAHGGARSLQLSGGAAFTFGRYENLPVKITMHVYDNGNRHGKKGHNGAAWGVQTAVGDNFVIRKVWRPYLAGDREYSWLNSGENQYFSPHHTHIRRKNGWRKWVFDFSDPESVSITCDGETVPSRALGTKYLPDGAVGIVFLGGAAYVDDIVIER